MRIEVLRCYRKLYRTCQRTFEGDYKTFDAARRKLREEFLKNSEVTDEAELSKLVEGAKEEEQFLRESVVQVIQTGEKIFRLKITKENVLADNMKPMRTDHKGLSKPDNPKD